MTSGGSLDVGVCSVDGFAYGEEEDDFVFLPLTYQLKGRLLDLSDELRALIVLVQELRWAKLRGGDRLVAANLEDQ